MDHFIAEITAQVGIAADWRGPEDIEAVLMMIGTKISQGEIDDIQAGLPTAIREFWPD